MTAVTGVTVEMDVIDKDGCDKTVVTDVRDETAVTVVMVGTVETVVTDLTAVMDVMVKMNVTGVTDVT